MALLQDDLHLKWKDNKNIHVTIKNKPKVTKDNGTVELVNAKDNIKSVLESCTT